MQHCHDRNSAQSFAIKEQKLFSNQKPNRYCPINTDLLCAKTLVINIKRGCAIDRAKIYADVRT